MDAVRETLKAAEAAQLASARETVGKLGVHLVRMPQPKHARVISRACEAFVERRIRNLMIFAPPRHLKSFYWSWFVPAAIYGRRPETRIIHAAHTQNLADLFGKRIRNTLGRADWPWPEVRVNSDASAKGDWTTTAGGEYFAVGMDGAPHGRPADVLIVDDPIRGHKDADSETVRESTWDAYRVDLQSRLEGQAQQLIMCTRWHEDDPPGRILPESFAGESGQYLDRETGEKWTVISLPARAEHENDLCRREIGQLLWHPDDGGPEQVLHAEKRGGRIWGALYQQRPAPDEGLMIEKRWIKRYTTDEMPPISQMSIYGASDYATDEKAGATRPDYTVHIVVGICPAGNIWVLDMWRGRKQADVWVREWLRLVNQWKPTLWGEEQGQIIKSVGPFLRAKMRKQGVFCARKQLTSSVSKEARAQTLVGLLAEGQVYIPWRTAWANDLIDEMLKFPTGRHDDQVDALSLLCCLVDRFLPGSVPKEEIAPPQDSIAGIMEREKRLRQAQDGGIWGG